MVGAGVSLRAVQTIGGWSSLRMVERYAHVNDAELARAVGEPCPTCQNQDRPRLPDDGTSIARRTGPPARHTWTLTKGNRQIACWLTFRGESWGWETLPIENGHLSA